MSSKRRPRSPAPASEEAVVERLSVDPELLLRHPDVLRSLRLRHDCGSAASLIEHQVRVLREEGQTLRRRLDELVAVARYNDALAERLHELTLELISAPDLGSAVANLRAGLQEGFGADAVGLALLGDTEARPVAEVVSRDADGLTVVQSALADGRPLCGRLSEAQRRFLFGDAAERIASAALVPLVDGAPVGVLGIGSFEPQRFHSGQGTAFLRRLGALVARVLRECHGLA